MHRLGHYKQNGVELFFSPFLLNQKWAFGNQKFLLHSCKNCSWSKKVVVWNEIVAFQKKKRWKESVNSTEFTLHTDWINCLTQIELIGTVNASWNRTAHIFKIIVEYFDKFSVKRGWIEISLCTSFIHHGLRL